MSREKGRQWNISRSLHKVIYECHSLIIKKMPNTGHVCVVLDTWEMLKCTTRAWITFIWVVMILNPALKSGGHCIVACCLLLAVCQNIQNTSNCHKLYFNFQYTYCVWPVLLILVRQLDSQMFADGPGDVPAHRMGAELWSCRGLQACLLYFQFSLLSLISELLLILV